jgi:hypothetical protein
MLRTPSMMLVALLLSACGGSQPSDPVPEPVAPAAPEAPAEETPTEEAEPEAAEEAPPEAAPIQVGKLEVVLQGKGGKPTGKLTLAPDGTVKSSKDGKIVLQDADGRWVLRVEAEGAVKTRMTETVMKDGKIESEKDSVETLGNIEGESFRGKSTLKVNDDGSVSMTDAEGKEHPDAKLIKVNGVTPATRHAATLLIIAALTPTKMTTSSSSSPASPVPATPQKK